jgi:hypothetical protein
MDSVGNAFLYTMNWNPAYSYSTLPAGYNYDSIPAHWKVMLHKVEPAEKGVPHFKDIYVSNVKVKYAKKAMNASGDEKSILQNFNFNNVNVNAATAGDIGYAENWNMKNVTIKAIDKSKVVVKNSTGVNF